LAKTACEQPKTKKLLECAQSWINVKTIGSHSKALNNNSEVKKSGFKGYLKCEGVLKETPHLFGKSVAPSFTGKITIMIKTF